MKSIQKTRYVVGNEVFFIEQGVPHTGLVKKVYENMLILDHVTFVDPIFDKLTRKPIEHELWEVRPEDVIKTAQYYLPVHPSIEMQIYIKQLMHSASNDNEMMSTWISKFFDLYKEKTLFSTDSSLFYPYPDNYIEFNGNMIITMDGFSGSYFVPLITRTLGRTYYALEQYTEESLTEPVLLILPSWKDNIRGKAGNRLETEDRIKIDYLQRHRYLGMKGDAPQIVYMDDVNEDSIIKIYQVSERTLQYYFSNKPVTALFYRNEKGINIHDMYATICYKKRERS